MATEDSQYRRVNILIRHDQHELIQEADLSLSGLVRDLIDDWMSETKVTLSLSPEAKKLYDLVVSNFGASDKELERFVMAGLDSFLQEKTKEIESIRKKLSSPKTGKR